MNWNFSTTKNHNVWFISDIHIAHKNIIRFANRPFGGVAEMDNVLLSNIQNTVKSQDVVFHLGDLSFSRGAIERIVPKLPGTWYWIRGNHDKPLEKYLRDTTGEELYDLLNIVVDGQAITLCHYPMISWLKSHYGTSWQLYGHHHWRTFNPDLDNPVQKILFGGKKLNMAVENWNYRPASFQQVRERMSLQPNNWDYTELEDKYGIELKGQKELKFGE